MAEVQRANNAGESTQQFIEFVMMQAQNASLFLGLIPHPGNDQPEVNLPLARMFIDQLSMIQEKTRGNLVTEETNVLRNALSNLQMAYVEVAKGGAISDEAPATASAKPVPAAPTEPPRPESTGGTSAANAVVPATETVDEKRESRKRFTKSYGG